MLYATHHFSCSKRVACRTYQVFCAELHLGKISAVLAFTPAHTMEPGCTLTIRAVSFTPNDTETYTPRSAGCAYTPAQRKWGGRCVRSSFSPGRDRGQLIRGDGLDFTRRKRRKRRPRGDDCIFHSGRNEVAENFHRMVELLTRHKKRKTATHTHIDYISLLTLPRPREPQRRVLVVGVREYCYHTLSRRHQANDGRRRRRLCFDCLLHGFV